MRRSLGTIAALGSALVMALACTTPDPRAGKAVPKPSTPPPVGTNDIVDASVPTGALDCGSAPGANAPFTKAALLDAASRCSAWHACNFVNAATTLKTTFGDHVASPNDEMKLAVARASWRAAMNEWSKMELFQFGPVASKIVDRYHGRGLRTFIHPWPDLNRCQVETQVASKAYEQAGWDAVFPNSRGLFAIEYVLFYPGADTACLGNSTTAKTWATLSAEQVGQAKRQYATAVADNVATVARELRNVWLPEGENFSRKLSSFEGYGSEQETLNVVAWSLYYAEKEIKDLKVAPLAGVQAGVPIFETPFARVEIENLRANLQAWRALFQGCSADGTGIGFDDWLIAAGQDQLARDMLAALTQAELVARTFPSFGAATQEQFVELYDALKPLTDLIKTSFFGSASPLNLKLPASAASDTD